MDYRELLKKYIKHVKECEGVDFIESINLPYKSSIEFSDEEEQEMENLKKEIENGHPNI